MAGYSKIYCIGGLGGFEGADGINPIRLQIWQGEGQRQWFEPHYFDKRIKPMGDVKSLVPDGPDDPIALLDACLAFYPQHFRECPSLSRVRHALRGAERLDFNARPEEIPAEWPQLRQEAWPYFRQLNIFVGELERIRILEEQP